jgi:hypothetical protein
MEVKRIIKNNTNQVSSIIRKNKNEHHTQHSLIKNAPN